LTADDLAELELAYAPPYGSAKDPVNMIGFVAGNVLSGRSSVVHADAIPAGSFLLDVRESAEFEAGSLPGAVNIPLATLRSRLSELPKDRKIVVFCRSGQRSYNAERILKANGFDVANLSGAYLTWRLFNPGELKNNPAAPSPALSSGTPGIVITPAPERVPSQGASCAALDAAGRPLEGSSCCALPPVSQSGAESSIDVRGLQCPVR
jgi:rhodanese-related sulfurtransferase